ncbi:MAG TPA: VWA domain-containing protein, partial [Nocardioidaceae bacterium]|nr:VWA domain-containing protein [Nocardioidaceae bacterium]
MGHDADVLLLGFARALRAAGLRVTADRSRTLLEAVAVVGLDDEQAVYWAGRAAVCAGPEDLRVYDRVFDAWFHGDAPVMTTSRPRVSVVQASLDDSEGAGETSSAAARAVASDVEVLRHRDIADLSDAERERLAALFAGLRPRLPTRTAYRHQPWRRGSVDRRATLRRMRSSLGEPVSIAWQHRSVRPRRVVLLVDVSGSMSPYADALLRLAHRVSTKGPVETFTLGTRLTRVTRAMRLRDPDRAVAAAGEAVPDWSGGTRLGETLKAFLDRWGQRGLARGAVVVVFSDGWERGDAA